ncbi:hypothetical protein EKO04_008539 [Ascochyta lentis]|uniref:F-box domain-containing protein n=1 Tax=Ascochyta lentis TaxID=205686 RepID=A0A8H7IZU9_9PLEO|nr:hypothetical protein EKO04_008539 [Ascochyta lentis]
MDRSVQIQPAFSAYRYDAIAKHNQLGSPLLRLPAELRNRIYKFAFDSATVERDLSPRSTQRYRIVPNSSRLLLVCRQLRYEAFPFRKGSKYHHLTLRMDGRDLSQLVDLIGQMQCADICCIEMFMSLASSIHRNVKSNTLSPPYGGAWNDGESHVFKSLSRIVVTYAIRLDAGAEQIGASLRTLFGNAELKVVFRSATYWCNAATGFSESQAGRVRKKFHLTFTSTKAIMRGDRDKDKAS